MDTFDGKFTVTVTANSDSERERAVSLLSRLLGACTRLDGQGLWQGIGEPCVVLETWFHTDTGAANIFRALRAAQLLQSALRQEAMFITVTTPGQNMGRVVYAGDWPEFLRDVRYVIDPGLALADWFDANDPGRFV